jgi:2-phosphoglycerate kinase
LESLRVVGPDGPRPFMRGILVQSLVSRGVPFEVALETATRVRERIVEQGEVEPDELRKLVDELLPAEYELEPPPRRSLGLDPPRVKSQRGTSTPFSKGMLSVSLQGAGLDPTDAYQVSQELETRLLQSGATEIGRAALRDLVADTIERSHGSRAVARYRVWRATFEDPKPLFVLLGGSSGAGKTTVAVEVARRLEISRVIGTDSIRQIMRLMFSKDLMPEIHCSTYDAYQILERDPGGGPSDFRARLLAGYREQAQKIAVGVQALLDRALEENASMLIEGANLLDRGGQPAPRYARPRSLSRSRPRDLHRDGLAGRGAVSGALHDARRAGAAAGSGPLPAPLRRDSRDPGPHPGSSGALRAADHRQCAARRDDPRRGSLGDRYAQEVGTGVPLRLDGSHVAPGGRVAPGGMR